MIQTLDHRHQTIDHGAGDFLYRKVRCLKSEVQCLHYSVTIPTLDPEEPIIGMVPFPINAEVSCIEHS